MSKVRTGLVTLLVLAACTTLDSPVAPDPDIVERGKPATVVVCVQHKKTGEWKAKEVGDNQVQKELLKGALLPGDPVPGMAGKGFDDQCNIVDIPTGSLLISRPVSGGFANYTDRELHLRHLVDGSETSLFVRNNLAFPTVDAAVTRVFYHITFEGGILRRDAPFTSETAAFGGVNYQMKFSYDNTKLVWIREATLCGGVCREVWISDRDMSNPVQITSDGFTDDRPALSPDNQRVVFSSRRDGGEGGDLDLFYMNANGAGITQLTATTADDWAPVYSRDGTKILFYSTRSGDRALWIMNADGSSPRMLPGTEGLGWEGRWSPDDKWIAFNGIADVVNTRDWAVWIMPSDGSAEPVRLTPEGEVEQIFGWIPG